MGAPLGNLAYSSNQMNILDALSDGLSENETRLSQMLRDGDSLNVTLALAYRCEIKRQSIENKLFLSDESVDALAAALILANA